MKPNATLSSIPLPHKTETLLPFFFFFFFFQFKVVFDQNENHARKFETQIIKVIVFVILQHIIDRLWRLSPGVGLKCGA